MLLRQTTGSILSVHGGRSRHWASFWATCEFSSFSWDKIWSGFGLVCMAWQEINMKGFEGVISPISFNTDTVKEGALSYKEGGDEVMWPLARWFAM